MALQNRYYFPNRIYFNELVSEISTNGGEPPCMMFVPRTLPFNPFIVGNDISVTNIENALAGIANIAVMSLTGTNRKAVKSNMVYITPADLKTGGLDLVINKDTAVPKNSTEQQRKEFLATQSASAAARTSASKEYAERYNSDEDTTAEDKPIQIIMPMKPIQTGLQQNWTDNQDVTGGGLGAIGNAIAQGVSAKIADFLGGGDILAINQANSGAYSYTATRKMYTGSTPQSFTFDFDYVPRNEKEAQDVLQIVNLFRFLSMAQSRSDQENQAIMVGRMPAIWSLTFFGLPDNMLKMNNRYEFMVCTSVNVTFGEGEFFSGFKTGTSSNKLFPNQIKLSLSFDEFFSNHSAIDYFGNVESSISG